MYMMNKIIKRPSGFTVVELLIATSVFAAVLILITTGILQFTRQYYKGVVSSKTQNTARAIMDDVVRTIQFNGGDVYALTSGGTGYCIGESKRYSYSLNWQVTDGAPNATLNQAKHGLIADNITGCNAGTSALNARSIANLSAATNQREMLGQNMRLAKLNISGSGDLYNVTVKVIYGDNDLLEGAAPNQKCRSTVGSQFCAVSELNTTVNKRVN
jgi:type II secretory pathway pseudopilin PulG